MNLFLILFKWYDELASFGDVTLKRHLTTRIFVTRKSSYVHVLLIRLPNCSLIVRSHILTFESRPYESQYLTWSEY
jgi:hypothetical protein